MPTEEVISDGERIKNQLRINVRMETIVLDSNITAVTYPTIKRVELEDDGTLTAVIDSLEESSNGAEGCVMDNHTNATPAEAGGLVERLRGRAESYRMGGPSSEHTAALLDDAATDLASERAAHAETKRERDEALTALREVRREISKTHKNAVKHENCERQHCPICEGGLFQCADCGAAEIETEQRVCTGSETRLAEALRALAALKSAEGILSRSGYAEWPGGSIAEIRAAIRVLEGGEANG